MRNTFFISLSTNKFDHKPDRDKETGDIRFERREVTIDEFISYITNGYVFTSLFKNDWRKGDNYECTSIIVYDIDHSTSEMFDYIESLSIKPTFSYTSSSNTEGDYRFRLIYLLNDTICNLNEYKLLSMSLAKHLNLSSVDTRSYQGEQMWFGSINAQTYSSDTVLSKSDIVIDASVAVEVISKVSNTRNKKPSVKPNINTITLGVSDGFLNDFENMSFKDVLDKYEDEYGNVAKCEHTELILDEDTPIVEYPEDYYEIRRKFCKSGDELKLKDGDRRRRSIFINLIIRKIIFFKNHDQSLSYESLLYCAVYELYYHIINSKDDAITKKDLAIIATNVMKTDANDQKYQTLGKPKHKSMVNPLYCIKHNLTKKQVIGNARNKKQFIGEYYDPSLTVNENLKVMHEYGFDVSKPTLERWMKENGISKSRKQKTISQA